jgi:hypothetical protein
MKVNLFILAAAATFLWTGCGKEEKKPDQLAQQYCGSCHIFPDPSLLDKKTWETGVLPQMAFRMGIEYTLLKDINQNDMPEVLKVLPDQAMVTEKEWIAIRDYYLANAPDSLALIKEENYPSLPLFKVSEIKLSNNEFPLVTLVRHDSITEKIFIGNRSAQLYQLNQNFFQENSFQLTSPASNILFAKGNNPIVTTIGIMDPNDQPKGKVNRLNIHDRKAEPFIDSLKRPVYLDRADLNNDHLDDYVVAAFGNYTGALYAYESWGKNYKQHIIHGLPGTRKTIVKDFNDDGLNDILALITQGDEQITLFINEGDFKFTPKILMRFPSVYGSSYFELADFNKDGKFDILYTNGDNADFSPIFKPYHGVRIFQQGGDLTFTESWFYPMYGASQALARDFDKDGDIDIAAISFFPDFHHHPEHGFFFFENKDNKFYPYATPLAAAGRWITIEAADFDHDTDVDLLLGALDFSGGVPDSLFKQWQEKNTSILLLTNTLH